MWAYLGLGCVPWSWLLAHGGYLGLDCLPMVAAMAMVACTQACLGLGCLPMGATLALVAACSYIWSDFLKMRDFLEKK